MAVCDRVDHSAPYLVKLPNVQHLATDVEARLPNDMAPLELLGRLHPTAAVGGTPRTAALETIRALEGPRGRYAGPVGWMDARGNAEWGIALRCAEVSGDRIRLQAGAGLVHGSDPGRELAEIGLKLRAVTDTLPGTGGGRHRNTNGGDGGDDVATLAALWLRWWQIGHTLTGPDWTAPTRLPLWRVQDLYAHVARGVDVLAGLLAHPSTAPAQLLAAPAYFKAVQEGPISAEDVARAAIRFGASTGTDGMVALFGHGGITVLTAAAALPPQTALDSVAGPISVGGYLATRIVEAAVHLLDLQAALSITTPLPQAARRRTVQILAQLPSPEAFIEAATGRAPAGSCFPGLT